MPPLFLSLVMFLTAAGRINGLVSHLAWTTPAATRGELYFFFFFFLSCTAFYHLPSFYISLPFFASVWHYFGRTNSQTWHELCKLNWHKELLSNMNGQGHKRLILELQLLGLFEQILKIQSSNYTDFNAFAEIWYLQTSLYQMLRFSLRKNLGAISRLILQLFSSHLLSLGKCLDSRLLSTSFIHSFAPLHGVLGEVYSLRTL